MKTFLEIGSCDFDTLNYLSNRGWRGVIVEPIKKYLDNLPRNQNVEYINAAITDKDGVVTMYHAPQEIIDNDSDFKGMNTLLSHSNPNLTESTEVRSITFDTLFNLTNINTIDYLKIDAEGYDAMLLSMFPWDRIQPNYIKFESEHLADDLLNDVLRKLSSLGYHCEVDEHNTYAIKL